MAMPHKYCPWCGYRYGDPDLSCTNCGDDRGFFEGEHQPAAQTASTQGRQGDQARTHAGQERWTKVLWKPHKYEDNYVDKETFLNSLVTNANVRPFHYWAMARGSLGIIRTISAAAIFGVVFTFCWCELLSAQSLLVVDTTIFLIAQVYLLNFEAGCSSMDVRRVFILVVALAALTPILHTLTREWHDHTILVLSLCCLCAHLLTGQYSLATQVRGVSSMNAAILASVLAPGCWLNRCQVMLASRLQSNELVFGFLLFAVAVFGLLPALCHQLEPEQLLRLTMVLATAATLALFPLSRVTSTEWRWC
eukprot:TRINITY_DN11412_c0_g1_i6.p1 TRINITY_DN11412_c0_g1~~TRINITY_DN11412_c0_g1_i6.p1  ORF type:complete len:307 (-),score=70.74 TRINITY_DN11412_c0_g1_i6:448-1368(-)